MGEAIGQSVPMAVGQNSAVIMAILCLVIGVKLIGQALGGLTS